jgi:hypothetical protein
MDQPATHEPHYSLASLIIADHPYFEDREGRHLHLVLCRFCFSITLETFGVSLCQVCDSELAALEKDLIQRMVYDDWDLAL